MIICNEPFQNSSIKDEAANKRLERTRVRGQGVHTLVGRRPKKEVKKNTAGSRVNGAAAEGIQRAVERQELVLEEWCVAAPNLSVD